MNGPDIVHLSFQLESLRFHVAQMLEGHVEGWRAQIIALVKEQVTPERLAAEVGKEVKREVDQKIRRLIDSEVKHAIDHQYGSYIKKGVERLVRDRYMAWLDNEEALDKALKGDDR